MDFSEKGFAAKGSRRIAEEIVGAGPCAGDYSALHAAGAAPRIANTLRFKRARAIFPAKRFDLRPMRPAAGHRHAGGKSRLNCVSNQVMLRVKARLAGSS
jgi:hypothetical protein